MVNETFKEYLQYLGLSYLRENWDTVLKASKKEQSSYHNFLKDILEKEYLAKKERSRLLRIQKANIPEHHVINTFPFARQPKLKKRLIMELYDSMGYMTKRQDLIFIGPTGCGKTGLATSFLIHAINQGHRGYFIELPKLIKQLRAAKGDYTLGRLLKRLQSYEILLIDEYGYEMIDKDIAGSFFELLKARHNRGTTLITTQLGFEEWHTCLRDTHLIAALLDRVTVNCTLFDMKDCISVREKHVVHAASK